MQPPGLTRYWFVVEKGYGFGVTAFSQQEAYELAASTAQRMGMPFDVVKVIADVDIRTLDQNHVTPNMAPPTFRGVWFPCLNI